MSYFTSQQGYTQNQSRHFIQNTHSVRDATIQSTKYLDYDETGLQKRMNDLNADEQTTMRSLVGQTGQQLELGSLRLSHIRSERQELLKLTSNSGYVNQEYVTNNQSQYIVGNNSGSIIWGQHTSADNLVKPSMRKSVSWVNAHGFHKELENNKSNVQVLTNQADVEHETKLWSMRYVSNQKQPQSTMYSQREHYDYRDKSNDISQQSQRIQQPTSTIRTERLATNANERFSESLSNVIKDPELALNNYETFIDENGNRHIRYVVKMTFIDNPITDERSDRMQQTYLHNNTGNNLDNYNYHVDNFTKDTQDKPIEHTTYDKDGNPVRVYTTVDENGQPLQVINIMQGDEEIQYVSHLNSEGRQEVKLLADFIKEHSPDAMKDSRLSIAENISRRHTEQRQTEFQNRHSESQEQGSYKKTEPVIFKVESGPQSVRYLSEHTSIAKVNEPQSIEGQSYQTIRDRETEFQNISVNKNHQNYERMYSEQQGTNNSVPDMQRWTEPQNYHRNSGHFEHVPDNTHQKVTNYSNQTNQVSNNYDRFQGNHSEANQQSGIQTPDLDRNSDYRNNSHISYPEDNISLTFKERGNRTDNRQLQHIQEENSNSEKYYSEKDIRENSDDRGVGIGYNNGKNSEMGVNNQYFVDEEQRNKLVQKLNKNLIKVQEYLDEADDLNPEIREEINREHREITDRINRLQAGMKIGSRSQISNNGMMSRDHMKYQQHNDNTIRVNHSTDQKIENQQNLEQNNQSVDKINNLPPYDNNQPSAYELHSLVESRNQQQKDSNVFYNGHYDHPTDKADQLHNYNSTYAQEHNQQSLRRDESHNKFKDLNEFLAHPKPFADEIISTIQLGDIKVTRKSATRGQHSDNERSRSVSQTRGQNSKTDNTINLNNNSKYSGSEIVSREDQDERSKFNVYGGEEQHHHYNDDRYSRDESQRENANDRSVRDDEINL